MSPRILSLPEAVNEIIDATKPSSWQLNHPNPVSRFFFITGAGISFPSIPLATGIEELCRKELSERGRTPSPAAGSALDRYETVFREAFAHPEDRRAFLHHHITRAPISAANFRLAHLVSSGKLTNLVVTTNFDELLTKALRLFGNDVLVCDHPKTTQRIDPKRADLQVIHVHGTHWFYDCCNLKDEIEDRAQPDRDDNTSMAQLLDRILFDRSPLVVGYSGWEGDVVMAALKRRLMTPLRYNLYWFCFRRADLDALPLWLKEHGNVRFIAPPPAPLAEKSGPVNTSPHAAEEPSRAMTVSAGTTVDSRPKEPILPARLVLDLFIRGLSLEGPQLTKSPLDFFADQIQRNLAATDVPDEEDIYLIQQVIRHIKEGAELARSKADERSLKEKENTARLDRVSEAVRGANYATAIDTARTIEPESLSKTQRADLERTLETVYGNIADPEPHTGLSACETRLAICESARKSGDADATWLLRKAKALFGKGYCLGKLGRRPEAIATYQQIVEQIDQSSALPLKQIAAWALCNSASSLDDEGDKDAALVAYEEVIRRFGDATEPFLKGRVATAFFNKALMLAAAGNQTAALDAHEEIIRRFVGDSTPDTREVVARALFNKGLILATEGNQSKALDIHREVIRRFDDATEIPIQSVVAWAYINTGSILEEANKHAEALAAYSKVITKFGGTTIPSLHEQVGWALLSKGLLLQQEEKLDEAVAAYDEIIQRFGYATNPAVDGPLSWAFINKADILAIEGKWGEAIASYDGIIRRFGDTIDSEMQEKVSTARARRHRALSENSKQHR